MFILMDKPTAASWFELGTILEIQPAYGFDLALPPPQIVSPLSTILLTLSTGLYMPVSSFPGKLTIPLIPLIYFLSPSLSPLQALDDWS